MFFSTSVTGMPRPTCSTVRHSGHLRQPCLLSLPYKAAIFTAHSALLGGVIRGAQEAGAAEGVPAGRGHRLRTAASGTACSPCPQSAPACSAATATETLQAAASSSLQLLRCIESCLAPGMLRVLQFIGWEHT